MDPTGREHPLADVALAQRLERTEGQTGARFVGAPTRLIRALQTTAGDHSTWVATTVAGCREDLKFAEIERELRRALSEKMVLDWDFLPLPQR